MLKRKKMYRKPSGTNVIQHWEPFDMYHAFFFSFPGISSGLGSNSCLKVNFVSRRRTSKDAAIVKALSLSLMYLLTVPPLHLSASANLFLMAGLSVTIALNAAFVSLKADIHVDFLDALVGKLMIEILAETGNIPFWTAFFSAG